MGGYCQNRMWLAHVIIGLRDDEKLNEILLVLYVVPICSPEVLICLVVSPSPLSLKHGFFISSSYSLSCPQDYD